MKRPSLGALVVGLIPFCAVCFSVSLWDRIHPIVFGLPFNFFWVILWIVLTPIFLLASYRLGQPWDDEPPREPDGQN
jgi:Protein of unknown function (DUF3311)